MYTIYYETSKQNKKENKKEENLNVIIKVLVYYVFNNGLCDSNSCKSMNFFC